MNSKLQNDYSLSRSSSRYLLTVILETFTFSFCVHFQHSIYACVYLCYWIGQSTTVGIVRGVKKGWQLEAELTSNLNPMRSYIVARLFHSRVVNSVALTLRWVTCFIGCVSLQKHLVLSGIESVEFVEMRMWVCPWMSLDLIYIKFMVSCAYVKNQSLQLIHPYRINSSRR